MIVPAFAANNFSFHVEVSLFHQLTGNSWLYPYPLDYTRPLKKAFAFGVLISWTQEQTLVSNSCLRTVLRESFSCASSPPAKIFSSKCLPMGTLKIHLTFS